MQYKQNYKKQILWNQQIFWFKNVKGIIRAAWLLLTTYANNDTIIINDMIFMILPAGTELHTFRQHTWSVWYILMFHMLSNVVICFQCHFIHLVVFSYCDSSLANKKKGNVAEISRNQQIFSKSHKIYIKIWKIHPKFLIYLFNKLFVFIYFNIFISIHF